MTHARLFAFESDFVSSLRCIPMAVRFKLDRVGVKLSLRQWSRFTPEDRRGLLTNPCQSASDIAAYRDALTDLVRRRAGEEAKPLPPQPEPLWEQARQTAAAVADCARLLHHEPPTDAEWARLTELERFVLVKLTRDSHDNVNFLPALAEFGLARPRAAA